MPQQNQTVDLTVTLDRDLKTTGEVVFRDLGLTWSTAFTALVRQTVRRGRLPFELDEPAAQLEAARSIPPARETKEEYYAEIAHRRADMRAGVNCATHEPIEVDD